MIGNTKEFAPLTAEECSKIPVGVVLHQVLFDSRPRQVVVHSFEVNKDLSFLKPDSVYFNLGQKLSIQRIEIADGGNLVSPTFDECRNRMEILFFSGELSNVFRWLAENIQNRPT